MLKYLRFLGGNQEGGFFRRVLGTVTSMGSGLKDQISTLKSEIEPLEEFGRHLFLEMVELNNMKVRFCPPFYGLFRISCHFLGSNGLQ